MWTCLQETNKGEARRQTYVNDFKRWFLAYFYVLGIFDRSKARGYEYKRSNLETYICPETKARKFQAHAVIDTNDTVFTEKFIKTKAFMKQVQILYAHKVEHEMP